MSEAELKDGPDTLTAWSTTTSALSAQAQAERAQAIAPSYYQAPYNTGLFG